MSLSMQYEAHEQRLVPESQCDDPYKTEGFSKLLTLQQRWEQWIKLVKIGFVVFVVLHVVQVGFLIHLAVKVHTKGETEDPSQELVTAAKSRWEKGTNVNGIAKEDRQGLPGPKGIPGLPGLKGEPGHAGLKGEPGLSGSKGEQGLRGLKGGHGLPGLKGDPGVPGLKGAPGMPGLKGDPGVPGLNGDPGLPGLTGRAGLPGLKGDRGMSGIKGEPGLLGMKGEPGLPGLPGQSGLPGLKGSRGMPGINGKPGLPGLNGPPGMTGLKGDRGMSGLKGEAGLSGLKGEPGLPGLTGRSGLPGIKGEKGEPGPRLLMDKTEKAGSVYIRFGKQTCTGNGTDLIYPGFVGGSHFSKTGAAVNYLCLPTDPIWGYYNATLGSGGLLYGGEYQLNAGHKKSTKFFGRDLLNHDAVCAVCLSNRPNYMMIPGRNKCYPGWTKEYSGYLTAGHVNHAAASEYVCLDEDAEYRESSGSNANGVLFYLVRGICGSLPCPPYVEDRQITCVVCTK